jgi:hypothetical protein
MARPSASSKLHRPISAQIIVAQTSALAASLQLARPHGSIGAKPPISKLGLTGD